MKLLVLGAGGQLGHDMARAARAAGDTVQGLSRRDLDLADPHGADGGDAGTGSAADSMAARLRLHSFDALVNCAGYTRVDDAEDDPAAAFTLNAVAVARLAHACAAVGARMVQVSTDYVFDGRSDRPYREGDAPAPLNVYGASKLMGEALAGNAHPAGALVIRTASLFGIAGAHRADSGQGGNFVETMIRRAARTGRVQVVDDIVMSPTATPDLARAILTLLRADAPAGTYHVVNRGRASWCQFAHAILKAADIPAHVEPVPASAYPTRARRPRFSVLDTSKATAAGCDLRPWEDALEDYVAERTAVA